MEHRYHGAHRRYGRVSLRRRDHSGYHVSDDGENFTAVCEKATLSFDPMADNSAYMPFPETVTGQYILFRFYSNSGASAGQAAEIEVYGVK